MCSGSCQAGAAGRKERIGVLGRDVEKGCSRLCTSSLPPASATRMFVFWLPWEGLGLPNKAQELVSRFSPASLEKFLTSILSPEFY